MKKSRGATRASGGVPAPKNERVAHLAELLRSHRDDSLRRLHAAKSAVRHEGGERRDDGLDEVPVDPLETAVDVAVLELASRTIQRIDFALERLARGSYGNCIVCGEEIEEKRLRALPFASRCRDCEDAWERGDRGRAE